MIGGMVLPGGDIFNANLFDMLNFRKQRGVGNCRNTDMSVPDAGSCGEFLWAGSCLWRAGFVGGLRFSPIFARVNEVDFKI